MEMDTLHVSILGAKRISLLEPSRLKIVARSPIKGYEIMFIKCKLDIQ